MDVSSDNILTIINSKSSNLLSKIKIGEKISVTFNNENKVSFINYIKNFRSGVKAELKEGIYQISSYELGIEKERIYKSVTIKDSLYSPLNFIFFFLEKYIFMVGI